MTAANNRTLVRMGSQDMPLASRIRKVLSDEILSGRLEAGTRLDEVVLAERFSVSRTPVREALKQLISSGMVEHRHRRGVFVIDIPRERLAEMFEFAAEMEALCARMAALNMTRAEREALLAIHLDSHAHVLAGDVDAYDTANMQLHEALFRGAHNHYLEQAVLRARAKVAPYRRAQFQIEDRPATSFAEHGEIVKAVLKGLADEAAQLLREHVQRSHLTSERYLDRDQSV